MEDNGMEDEGLHSLAEGIERARELRKLVSKYHISNVAFHLMHLHAIQGIIRNGISDVNIGRMVLAIKGMQSLKLLNLSKNMIGTDGCRQLALALASNKTITELVLQHNLISPVGAARIAQALQEGSALTVLDLQGNRISDQGCEVSLTLL